MDNLKNQGPGLLSALCLLSWILLFLHVLGIYYISYLMGVRAAQQKRSGKEGRRERREEERRGEPTAAPPTYGARQTEVEGPSGLTFPTALVEESADD